MRWLLTCSGDERSFSFYETWVRAAGAEPVAVGPDYAAPPSVAPYAALLLPGGGDVDPVLYGAPRHTRTRGVVARRDDLEMRLVADFLRRRRPVFGICRGMQVLNVAMGGGLLQHVPDLIPEEQERHTQRGSRDSLHPLRAVATTRLGAALVAAVDVNSSHHQAVDPMRLGTGLRVAARSGAGLIEALEDAAGSAPVCAVQWHPERLPQDHPASRSLRDYWASLSAR